MLNPEQQDEIIKKIIEIAKKRGFLVAPVGSAYFLFFGTPKVATKDVDAVLHQESGDPVPFETLVEIGKELGDEVSPSEDRAYVQVTITIAGEKVGQVDLLRGREGAGGGFLPRNLLREAARRGKRRGSLVLYPQEYVIALKADVAVDREERAAKKDKRSEENQRRADVFKQDVFARVGEAMKRGDLRVDYLKDACRHLKSKRQKKVAELIEIATAGSIQIEL